MKSLGVWTGRIFGWAMICALIVRAEDPREELGRLAARYQSAASWTCSVLVRSTLTAEGPGQQSFVRYALAFRKPDRFLARRIDGMPGVDFLFEKERIRIFSPSAHQFADRLEPAALAHLMRDQTEPAVVLFMNSVPFVYTLLTSDPLAHWLEGVTVGQMDARNDEGKVQLTFRQEAFDWTLLAKTGDDARILALAVDMGKTVRANHPESEATWMIQIEFSDWTFNTDPPDSVFALEVPESAIRISYSNLLKTPTDAPMPRPPAPPDEKAD
ncbi:MAG: DUF2092 domain-containing protein [Kiritimatiellia bacterium]|nr:DUF2092 domain-containing protein [Kiritimatiellia bacterium]